MLIRRFRTAAGLALVGLLLGALTSCQTDPGVAAYVGDTRISIDRVDSLYDDASEDPVSKPITTQYPAESRQILVGTLVQLELFRAAAKDADVSVSAGDVATLRQTIDAQRAQLEPTAQLIPPDLLAEQAAYGQALSQWAGAAGGTEAEVAKRLVDTLRSAEKKNHVTVNPRYGTYDAKTLKLNPSRTEGVVPAPISSASAVAEAESESGTETP